MLSLLSPLLFGLYFDALQKSLEILEDTIWQCDSRLESDSYLLHRFQ